MIRIAQTVALMAIVAGLVGCSGGRQKPFAGSVPVSGAVTYKGQPLAQGLVRFVPMDPKGQPATGAIQGGRFTMNTTVSSPGVVSGKYAVAIVSERPTEVPPLGPDGLPSQVMPKPESLIPERYTKDSTSGLQVDVAAGMKPLAFELLD
jgi:hypothetical protein